MIKFDMNICFIVNISRGYLTDVRIDLMLYRIV